MYAQNQNPIANAAKWVFFAFLLIILMAGLLGLNIRDATWFNSDIASAEADRIIMELANQQATYEQHQKLLAAQIEAEVQSIERDQDLLNARNQIKIQAEFQRLDQQDFFFKAMVILFAALISFAVARFIITKTPALPSKQIPAKTAPATPNHPPVTNAPSNGRPVNPISDPWKSPEYRREKVTEARMRERTRRKELLTRIEMIKDPALLSKEEFYQKPLAE